MDIATAREGDGSPDGKGTLKAVRGIEVGHVFKLGTFFTTTLGVDYLDENGTLKPPVMGCYGIGVTRVLAAAIEQNHDDKGIIFPAPIAPFQAHLLALNTSDPDVLASADALYEELTSAGCEMLYDDRAESAGVKFNDADLLSLPVRIVVSPRNLKQGVVEIKRRRADEATQVPADGVAAAVRDLLAMDEL